jgi:hypothetical protein
MLERAMFDAQLAGEEENGTTTRTKTIEKFNGGKSEDTAKTRIINWVRLRSWPSHHGRGGIIRFDKM